MGIGLTSRKLIGSRKFHLALLSFLMVGHTAVHYAILFPKLGELVEHLPFFDLHVLHESEFLIVIAYASWVFRLRGGIIALCATALASLPFILASHFQPLGYVEYGFAGPQNALIEVMAILAIGAFIVFVNERWARERDAKALAAEKLEQALSDLKAALGQLVQHERLSALGTMASGVAHDFQNALTPILGFSELLLNPSVSNGLSPQANEYVARIHTAANDATEMVGRLQTFYKPSADTATMAPVDLGRIVDETIALCEPRRKAVETAHRVSISVTHQAEVTPPVTGNASELREAFTNLLFNAFDALPEGGEVVVRTRRAGQDVAVEVKDAGVGMNEEVLQRCLEPFFTTKGERGTGLGLAMVHGIVQRHGGLIRVHSQAGKGTTFEIRLPVHREGHDLAEEGRGQG